jgi:hypothetical protein
MNSFKAISLAIVLAASVASLAQRGGHGGGGVRSLGTGHTRISAAPTANNVVSGRVIAPTNGFRGSYNARGNGYTPSRMVSGSYSGSGVPQYQNWGGNGYTVSHNLNGPSNRNQKNQQDNGHEHVHHMFGTGSGSWGNHLREGYSGWQSWRDGDFYFNNWAFTTIGDCAISPFYSYPWLPPYISESTVTVRPGISFNWGGGLPYEYKPIYDNFGYGNPALNCSIGQIRAIYGQNPVDAINYMVSNDQPIGIYSGGRYMYSLSGPDFTKILIDSAHSSYTIGFGINFVRQIGDNAVVNCTQTCNLPEGGEATFYQNYELCKVKDKYVVTGFMSSAKS